MGLTIVKKRGASIDDFIKAAIKTRKYFSNNSADQYAIVYSNRYSIFISTEKGFSNHSVMEKKLNLLSITNEDWAVITLNHFEHKFVGKHLKHVSPLILTSKLNKININPDGVTGNFFVATSDVIHPYNNNSDISSILQYVNTYLHYPVVKKHIGYFDFEVVCDLNKQPHKNLKIVFGSHQSIYIHNEGLFLDFNGILFSDKFIGNNIIKAIFHNKSKIPLKATKIRSSTNYFIKRKELKLLQNKIFFQKDSEFKTLSDEKFVILEFNNFQLKMYSLKTELITSMYLYDLLYHFKAYWINKLHEVKSI
jgi:hypothetical protein